MTWRPQQVYDILPIGLRDEIAKEPCNLAHWPVPGEGGALSSCRLQTNVRQRDREEHMLSSALSHAVLS
ncbi:hypothetical protein ACROYT_G015338 [Oculina patagonica]